LFDVEIYGLLFDTFVKKLFVRHIIQILFLMLFITDLSAQSDTLKNKNDSLPGRFYLLQKVERNGVTMPEVEIKEVTIVGSHRTPRRNEYRKYEKLISNIKKVYPYAIIVRNRLEQVNEDISNISGEKERKAYLKTVEKDVFAEYEDDIQNMTITQGRLLIKLIDRETQNTSYVLIREYRGKFSAAFWQGIARIFGTNLKEEYDPYGEDALIEFIIREVDAGNL
jgi:hypothetical protein